MLKYVQSMVEKFYDEVNSNIGIGIITYGDTAKVTTPLNSLSGPSYSRRDILRLIGETPQQGGSSAGFSQAMQLVAGFFSPQQGGRVGVRQVTTLRKIIITINEFLHCEQCLVFLISQSRACVRCKLRRTRMPAHSLGLVPSWLLASPLGACSAHTLLTD